MQEKFTINSFAQAKSNNKKITMVTAYDYTTARIVDESGIDTILVGDSLGMVVQGHENTLSVTVDEIIYHTKAVKRGAKRAFVVADMPFMSYHTSVQDAVANAGRIVKESGAEAIKLEGGKMVIEKIEAIVAAQIPVVGHIGLTPQSVNIFGGFKVQGKQLENARAIVEDAMLLERAGVCAIVLEGIPELLAQLITEAVSVPTIGIGAGKHCDGQVLVISDLLGMNMEFVPKFVKRYRALDSEINSALKEYSQEVQMGEFPEKIHSFQMSEEVIEEIRKDLNK